MNCREEETCDTSLGVCVTMATHRSLSLSFGFFLVLVLLSHVQINVLDSSLPHLLLILLIHMLFFYTKVKFETPRLLCFLFLLDQRSFRAIPPQTSSDVKKLGERFKITKKLCHSDLSRFHLR